MILCHLQLPDGSLLRNASPNWTASCKKAGLASLLPDLSFHAVHTTHALCNILSPIAQLVAVVRQRHTLSRYIVRLAQLDGVEGLPACSGMRGSTGSVWSCFSGTTSKGLCDAPGLNSISTLNLSGLSTGTLHIPWVDQRGPYDVCSLESLFTG